MRKKTLTRKLTNKRFTIKLYRNRSDRVNDAFTKRRHTSKIFRRDGIFAQQKLNESDEKKKNVENWIEKWCNLQGNEKRDICFQEMCATDKNKQCGLRSSYIEACTIFNVTNVIKLTSDAIFVLLLTFLWNIKHSRHIFPLHHHHNNNNNIIIIVPFSPNPSDSTSINKKKGRACNCCGRYRSLSPCAVDILWSQFVFFCCCLFVYKKKKNVETEKRQPQAESVKENKSHKE